LLVAFHTDRVFSGNHFEAGSINTLQIAWFYRQALDSKPTRFWSPKASAFAKAPKAEALDSKPTRFSKALGL
jgi:hypothetical protein